MFSFMKKLNKLLPAESTLPGRAASVTVPDKHFRLPYDSGASQREPQP